MFSALFVRGGHLRAGWRFLAFAVAAAVLLIAHGAALQQIPAVASLLERARAGSITVAGTLISVGTGLVLVLGLTALAARLERRSFAAYGFPRQSAFGAQFRRGVLWGLAMTTLVIGATWLLGGVSFDPPSLSAAGIAFYAVAWAIAFTLVGLTEELLFRGYAFSALRAAIGFWPAAAILAALFGAVHLSNPGESVLGALNVVTYALFVSFTLQRTGNLWFAVGIHAAWDYATSVLYGVPVSGVRAEGHLLQAHIHGPTWLTGGSAGPEGSVLGLAALGIAFIVFARRVRRAPIQ